jgi:hypothetical protein
MERHDAKSLNAYPSPRYSGERRKRGAFILLFLLFITPLSRTAAAAPFQDLYRLNAVEIFIRKFCISNVKHKKTQK